MSYYVSQLGYGDFVIRNENKPAAMNALRNWEKSILRSGESSLFERAKNLGDMLHTLSEYIDMGDLYYTVARVESMIDDSPNVAMFKYIPLTPEDKILYPHWSVNDLYDMEGDDEE